MICREKRESRSVSPISSVSVVRQLTIFWPPLVVNPDTRVKDLTLEDETKLREYIDKNLVVEGDLRRDTALNIKRLIEIAATVACVTERACL